MTPFVIDASVTLAWCVDDERDANADAIAERVVSESAIVPALWCWEIGNALLMAERRGRVKRGRLDEILEELAALPISVDEIGTPPRFRPSVDLARQFALTVYDAAYLELALRRSVALATRDEALAAAARAIGIQIIA